MPQRGSNLAYVILALGAISLLGYLLRWSLDTLGAPPRSGTDGSSFAVGAAFLVIAGISFSLAEQWPVRVGGWGMLLGLGLIANLPGFIWLTLLVVSFCLLIVVATIRRINRA